MSTYTRSKPSFEGAARGNEGELLKTIQYLHDRLSDVERKTGGASFDLTTARPIAAPPQAAQIKVDARPGTGKFIVQLSSPENKNNVPLQHVLEFSDSPNFSRVESIPVGAQSYIEVSKFPAGTSKYIRVKSTIDGTTFSKPRVAGLRSS